MPHTSYIFPEWTTLLLIAKDFELSVFTHRKSEGYSTEIKHNYSSLLFLPNALNVLDKEKIPYPVDGMHHRRWPREPLERGQGPGRYQQLSSTQEKGNRYNKITKRDNISLT